MTNLIEVENLSVQFRFGHAFPWQQQKYVQAVTDVSLRMKRGEVTGLVGESGCGKTTLGRAILRLGPAAEATSSGRVIFDGRDLVPLEEKELRPLRRRLQIIFQDPAASLNPRMRVTEIIGSPLANFGMSRGDSDGRVRELMELVGLRGDQGSRFPHEFSGGQQQRIGIARALALNPEFIVCDEPVSSLDVSIQAQILNLLAELRERLGLTLLFVSHDLRVVRHLCDRIAVMYLGRIVEEGTAERIVEAPEHPYTRALVSAIPEVDPDASRSRIVLQGDLPSPVNPPSGCAFRTRCPMAVDACAQRVPGLREVRDRNVACDQLT